jgi:hypothetical protein
MGWQYRKINLNELPRRAEEIDVLCDAGEQGWELVTILPNNIAYLKRERIESGHHTETPSAVDEPERSSEVKAKYRDPVTGDTWSGRGRMATWLKKKQEAGEDIEKYRV